MAVVPNGISSARVRTWIGLLAMAQVADLVTTQVDMAHGGVEANAVAAGVLEAGGIALLWTVKLLLVALMALAVVALGRYRRLYPDRRAAFAHALVWRGIQVCVLVLVLTAAHNVAVLSQLTI